MASHGAKSRIDLAGFTDANPVNGRLHVIKYLAPGDATQNAEGLGQGIEKHLMCLQGIGPHNKRAAVCQLRVCCLKLRALTANHRPVFAPIKLKSLSGLKHQWHISAAPAHLLLA